MIDMTNFKKSVKWYDENLATLLPLFQGGAPFAVNKVVAGRVA